MWHDASYIANPVTKYAFRPKENKTATVVMWQMQT